MSLAEASAILSTLSEVDKMLSQVEFKAQTMRTEVGHASGELREMEYILFRTVSILGRLGLPPNIDKAIMKIQQLITTIRILHSAIMLMESTSPYGWTLAAISIISAGVMASTMWYDATRGY